MSYLQGIVPSTAQLDAGTRRRRPRRMRGLVAAAAVAAAVVGCGSSQTSDSGSSSSHAPATGEQLFASNGCGSCHTLAAANAHGAVGPDLDSLHMTRAQVVRQITLGGGEMPGFAKQMSTSQIDTLTRYLLSVAKH